MPSTELLVFRQANGRVPMEEWLDALPSKARAKCLYYMRLLAAFGHELRRLSQILCGKASTNCGPRTRAFRTAFCIFSMGRT
jgi:hypothetical protein